MINLEKKFLLITGASSGIGRQCAIQLSENHNLILCSRRIDELKKTKCECANSKNHLIFPIDLSEINTVEKKLSEFLISNNITIDKFLHCAGTLQLGGAKNFDINTCQNIYNVNVFSAMAIIKVLLRKPNKKALFKIVFISSLNSKKPAIGNSFYSSSKSALDGYMRCIAKELAPNIIVNSILPGAINTAITNSTPDEYKKEMEKNYPLGFGKTKDIANMAEYLFSEKSNWITGQQISVNGGGNL